MRSNTRRLLVLACCSLFFTGCVRESTSGQRHEFAFQWWVSALVLVCGVALTIGGGLAAFNAWNSHNSPAGKKWIVGLLIGPMIALGLAPSTFFYRIAVDQNGFSIRSGVWGNSIRDMKFANLNRIELVTTLSHPRRGPSQTNYLLKCDGKSGSVETIPLHYAVWSAVAKEALPRIEQNARSRGVVFVDGT